MSNTKVISIINQKGGVGKTTTTANLAYALSNMGRKVLVIDFDQQASLTNYLNVGLNDDEYVSIYEALENDLEGLREEDYPDLYDKTTEELLELAISRPTYIDREVQVVDGKRQVVNVRKEFGFDLLPSTIDLADYELQLSASSDNSMKVFYLSKLISQIEKIREYDYILIDCNPSLGILATNAIAAATDGILIPTNLDLMSTRGVRNLVGHIAQIQLGMYRRTKGEFFHKGVIGIVLNLYSERRMVDKILTEQIQSFYPFYEFKNKIPESSNAKKAVFEGVLFSQKYPKAEKAYSDLAVEMEERLVQMQDEEKKVYYFERGVVDAVVIDPDEFLNDEE